MPSAKKTSGTETIVELRLDQIDLDDTAFQFRIDLKVKDLAEDLKARGQDFPIVVRRVAKKKKYQLICGFRRVTALHKIGATTVKAVVRELSDDAAYQLSWAENEQRRTYSVLDRANAILKANRRGKKLDEIGALLGLGRRQLIRLKQIAEMPQELKLGLDEHKISTTHAVVLLEALRRNPEIGLEAWVDTIAKEKLSVSALRKRLSKESKPAIHRGLFSWDEHGVYRLRVGTIDSTRLDEKDQKQLERILFRLDVLWDWAKNGKRAGDRALDSVRVGSDEEL